MHTKLPTRRAWRAFWSAFMLTLCLLLLGSGFLVADYNTRRMGQGQASLRLDIAVQEQALELDLFGREQTIAWSDTVRDWAGRVWTLLPASLKWEMWLWEGEREAAPALLEAVGVEE